MSFISRKLPTELQYNAECTSLIAIHTYINTDVDIKSALWVSLDCK